MSMTPDASASTSTSATKVSVSMPRRTVEAVRARVSAREFSAFVTEAVDREIRRQNLDDLIAEYERKHGEIPTEQVEEADELWREAERRQAACRDEASA